MLLLTKAKATLSRRDTTGQSGDLPAWAGCVSVPPARLGGTGCLPVEILQVILGFLILPERLRVVVQRDLAACARVCRDWTESSLGLLYDDVTLQSQRAAERLADVLYSSRSAAHTLRVLSLPVINSQVENDKSLSRSFARILRHTAHLVELNITLRPTESPSQVLANLLAPLASSVASPSLRYLSIHFIRRAGTQRCLALWPVDGIFAVLSNPALRNLESFTLHNVLLGYATMPSPSKSQKVPPNLKHLGLRNISAFVEHRLHEPVRALTYALRGSLRSVEIAVDRAARVPTLDIGQALEPVMNKLESAWVDAAMTGSSFAAMAGLPHLTLLRLRLDALTLESSLPPQLDLLVLDLDITQDGCGYYLLPRLLRLVRLIGCGPTRPRQIIICVLATAGNVKVVRAAAGLVACTGDKGGFSVQTRLIVAGRRLDSLQHYPTRPRNILYSR